MVLLGALGSAASRWGVIGGISLNNPLALVLLVLLTWLLLCVCLAVLLYVLPPLYHWFLRRRAGHGADLPELPGAETGARQSASSLDETPEFGQAAGSLLVPGSLPQQRPGQQETLQQGALQHEARQSARFCPWCGLRNSSGSSSCVGCQRELPQMPGGEVGEGPLSGRTREAQPGLAARVSAASDRGCRRADQENEDSFLAVTGVLWGRDRLQPFGLFVVSDGMGGHMDGHKASRAAIESIYRAVVPVVIGEAQPEHALLALLEQAIQGVNERLYQANQQEHTTMGCTVTAALITGHTASICNVGDSRTYLLRPQSSLQRITVDHSLVEGLVVAGLIQRADVYTHPKRNQIFRCLGHQPWVEVDTFRQSLASGDVLLLCSDGLWEMIRDPEMEALLRQTPDLTQASRALVERANAHGGLDNITAIIAQLTEQAPCLARPGVATLSSTDARLLASPV
jgi:serine/threonine protein phosphatase PrpC